MRIWDSEDADELFTRAQIGYCVHKFLQAKQLTQREIATVLGIVTGKQLLMALAKAGFQVIRIKGSHHFVRHQDGRATVVPKRLRSHSR